MDPKALRDLFAVLRQRSAGALVRAVFPAADLRGAHLMRADLIGADLALAQLDHSRLEGARLGAASLAQASLRGVSLNAADLTEADLSGADLSEARLEGACLAATDLRGARLERISGEPASVAGAQIDWAMCKRSGWSEAMMIGWWRDGAQLIDIEAFPESVRRACATMPVDPDERQPHEKAVFAAEIEERRARLQRSQSIPPSGRRAEVWTRLSQSPPKILEAPGVPAPDVLTVPRLQEIPSDLEEQQAPPSLSRPDAPAFRAGELVLGARLLELLGSGEGGAVWKAKLDDDQLVVVKLFDQTRTTLGVGARSFRRSLRALSRVALSDAPAAVPKLHCVARNELSAVMEYFHNGNAAGIPALGWGVPETRRFFEQLCREVGKLHELGMTHRCLKPRNILVSDDLRPVLTDMNGVDLEEIAADPSSDYRVYAAPEELAGMGTESPTADIYSLGRVLHFLLLGADPSPQTQDVPPLDSLNGAPAGLGRIVRKATVRDPASRYQWVAELLEDLACYERAPEQVGMARQGPQPGQFPHELSSLPPGAPLGGTVAPSPKGKPSRAASKHASVAASKHASRAAQSQQREAWADSALRRRLGLAGVLGVALCASYFLVVPVPTQDGAAGVGAALCVAAGLASLLVPPQGERQLLFGTTLALLVMVLGVGLEPSHLAIPRWRYTVQHGSLTKRAEAACNLARRAVRNLDGVDLSRADMTGANLARVSFRRANLSRAKLVRAALAESAWEGANVTGTNFSGADLFGSSAAEAVGWSEAICDRGTVMPSDWTCTSGHPSSTSVTAAAR